MPTLVACTLLNAAGVLTTVQWYDDILVLLRCREDSGGDPGDVLY
jgi:hypothetical protein